MAGHTVASEAAVRCRVEDAFNLDRGCQQRTHYVGTRSAVVGDVDYDLLRDAGRDQQT